MMVAIRETSLGWQFLSLKYKLSPMCFRSNYRIFLVCQIMCMATLISCQQKTNHKDVFVGGPCEGCEAIHEFGNRILSNVDTLPGFTTSQNKLMVTGTVFQAESNKPAADVIIYIYHTDANGLYTANKYAKGWEQRHGSLRGWTKTGADGKYTFFTSKPAAYPDHREPTHIHMTIKEPTFNEYYIESIQFDDDPLLTAEITEELDDRGGSGIVHLQSTQKISIARRDIYLGLNIPDHPAYPTKN